MLVESILKRQGGTHVEMRDGAKYHFKDDGTGRHVAIVSNSEHLGRFLSITEGFRLVTDSSGSVAPATGALDAKLATGATVDVSEVKSDAVTKGDGVSATEVVSADDLTEDSDIELIRAAYAQMLGRNPNPNWKAATLLAGIAAAKKALSQ